MGYRRTPFAVGEWYHCYTRGIDKRTVFESEDDANRFQQLLYLANDSGPILRENFYHRAHAQVFSVAKVAPIVCIGAYALMSNHYHLLVQEVVDGGISKFMQKLGTGYSMYFNERHDRIGNVFVKPFRSKHIHDDAYLRKVLQYIHLNAAENFEALWKRGIVRDLAALQRKLEAYPYSSLPEYLHKNRPESSIIEPHARRLLSSGMPTFARVLSEMHGYFADLESEFKSKR